MVIKWSSRAVIESSLLADLRPMFQSNSRSRYFRCLHTALLCALLSAALLWLSQGAQAAPVGDDYLAGYITSILEHELHWPHDSFTVQVEQGAATITLRNDDHAQRTQAMKLLQHISGLQSVSVRSDITGMSGALPAGVNVDRSGTDTVYPVGDVFRPLLADPRQPHFSLSLREVDMPTERMTAASVGLGEVFGLYRSTGRAPGDGAQIGVDGGVFALFNLDEPTRELVNADYSLGVPLTWRDGDSSARLRLYHQSSHLGDGYLQRMKPTPVLLSYEALSLLYAHEWPGLRTYLGGEYRFDYGQAILKHMVWQGGVEYYGKQRLWGGLRLIASVDLKSMQQHHYALDASVQLGLESGGVSPGQRRVRVVLEGYRGYSPDGQLFNSFISAYGIGIYLGL